MTISEGHQYVLKAMEDIRGDLAEIKKEQKSLSAEMQSLKLDIAVMKTKAAIYSGVASFVMITVWSIIQPLITVK